MPVIYHIPAETLQRVAIMRLAGCCDVITTCSYISNFIPLLLFARKVLGYGVASQAFTVRRGFMTLQRVHRPLNRLIYKGPQKIWQYLRIRETGMF
jgi:hypothetical protein